MDKPKLLSIISVIVVLIAFAIPLAYTGAATIPDEDSGFISWYENHPAATLGEASTGVYAEDVVNDPGKVDKMRLAYALGFVTLLAPLLALLLAFLTKNVLLSLFLGVINGAWTLCLVTGTIFGAASGAFLNSTDYFVATMADRWDAGILMQVLVIGALIALISRMGGMRGLATLITRIAKGPRSAQVAIWLSGWIIFFDDYANALIIGPIMRTVCDKFRISREKLAYLVDSTAAPVAGIVLVSTWIGTEIVNINTGLSIAGITDMSAFGIFIETIPYRFYNILALFFVLATGLLLREYGPMAKAELRARTTGQTIKPGSEVAAEEDYDKDPEKAELKDDHGILKTSRKVNPPNIWNAIIPIAVMIISALVLFYTNGVSYIMAGEGIGILPDGQTITAELFMQMNFFEGHTYAYSSADASIVLFQAGLLACIVAIIMGFAQRIFTVKEGIDTWAHGMKSMVFVCIVLILAWSIGSVISDLGTSYFISGIFSDNIPLWIVPALIFIIAALISFATGTAYGTMAILLPLCIPLAAVIGGGVINGEAVDPLFIVPCSSAVLTGAIFGDHCSPISDTTILSSMGSGCGLMDHVQTQIGYSLTIAVISVVAYLLIGIGLPIWIVLPIGAVLCVAALLIFGKKMPTWDPKTEKLLE
ncbi:MAG: Arginine/ornithine antiporter ArcD [Methanocorpusculum sp. MCE]|nr:MAG: Arginine/ornithine antiporter ArcD [Methanocorpusculum sp. MCE]